MNRLIYADTFSFGNFHEGYNASSLKMFSSIFDDVHYYASKSSFLVVSTILKEIPLNVAYKSLYIPNPRNRIGSSARLFMPFFTSIYILIKAQKDDVIFFNFNSLWAFLAINIFTRLLKRKVLIMCHGEIEYLTNDVKLNFISEKMLRLFQSEKIKIAPTLYFCCLGESIKKNIIDIVGTPFKNKYLSFEHTWIFEEKQNCISNLQIKNTHIGLVGTIKQSKWLSEIIKFRKLLPQSIQLSVIGKVCCDISILIDAGISFVPGSENDYIPRSKMNDAINKLDIIVFLYPYGSYKLTASGALFDAIDSERFILSLKNDYFSHLFEHRAKVGQLFDCIEDMVNYITNIASSSIYQLDYGDIKAKLSPELESYRFRQELEQIDFIKKQ